MQIEVTNQKTKSIRSACSLAGLGSHGISSATAAAPAPNSVPSTTSWTIDPLRTEGETTGRGSAPAREATHPCRPLETPATSKVQSAPIWVEKGHNPVKEEPMGLGVSILLIAAGAILAFAVNAD